MKVMAFDARPDERAFFDHFGQSLNMDLELQPGTLTVDNAGLTRGFDGISSGVQAVVDGEISCTVAQDPYNMGYQCVKSLLDVVEGEKLDDFIDTGCKVITPDNAQEYLDKLKSLV